MELINERLESYYFDRFEIITKHDFYRKNAKLFATKKPVQDIFFSNLNSLPLFYFEQPSYFILHNRPLDSNIKEEISIFDLDLLTEYRNNEVLGRIFKHFNAV